VPVIIKRMFINRLINGVNFHECAQTARYEGAFEHSKIGFLNFMMPIV
jgi:hypothetical protein